jgi:hypothetical protein
MIVLCYSAHLVQFSSYLTQLSQLLPRQASPACISGLDALVKKL